MIIPKKLVVLYLLLYSSQATACSYKLTRSVGMQGFFSTFNTVLGILDYCDLHNCRFDVNFATSELFHDEDCGTNWWEYYFEPIHVNDVDSVPQEFKAYQKIIFSLAAQFEMSRARGHYLIQKYIKLKPVIEQKIDNFVEQYFKDSTVIGIHFRGTDKKQEAPTVTYEYVKNAVIHEIENPQVKLFIATDDANFLEYMHEHFGKQVIAIDAIRSHDEKAVHWPRSENMRKKGEDALVDCIILSKCSKIYKMASNLSDTSLKFNPLLPVIYLNSDPNMAHQSLGYSMPKTLNTVLSLLYDYENSMLDGAHINFPLKNNKSESQEITNWWEYYFEPLSFGVNQTKTEIPAYQINNRGLKTLFEMVPAHAHQLINTSIRIKPKIIEKVSNFQSRYLKNKYVIGIHYIKQYGIFQDQLQPSIPYDNIINCLKNKLKNATKSSYGKYTIFVYTNDIDFLTLIQKKFTHVVFYNKPLKATGRYNHIEQEQNTLINCLLLSKSNIIIGTATEILKVASQFNPNVIINALDTNWLEK